MLCWVSTVRMIITSNPIALTCSPYTVLTQEVHSTSTTLQLIHSDLQIVHLYYLVHTYIDDLTLLPPPYTQTGFHLQLTLMSTYQSYYCAPHIYIEHSSMYMWHLTLITPQSFSKAYPYPAHESVVHTLNARPCQLKP